VKKLAPIAAPSCSPLRQSGSISERYDGIAPVRCPLRETYRVYDKPAASLIMVTSPGGGGITRRRHGPGSAK